MWELKKKDVDNLYALEFLNFSTRCTLFSNAGSRMIYGVVFIISFVNSGSLGLCNMKRKQIL